MCQKVKQADSAYIAGTYGRFDAVMSKGEGAHYEGLDGKRYIDFGTGIGVTLFGACDPDWVAAVTHQLTTLYRTADAIGKAAVRAHGHEEGFLRQFRRGGE